MDLPSVLYQPPYPVEQTVTPGTAGGSLARSSVSPPLNEPSNATSSDTSRLKCPQCPSTFRRPEHLKRHIKTHTDGRAFACEVCGRGFSRTDSLQRHRHIHGDRAGQDTSSGAIRPQSTVRMACNGCVAARTKCSGSTPCERCARKYIACAYRRRDLGESYTENVSWQSYTPVEQTRAVSGLCATTSPANIHQQRPNDNSSLQTADNNQPCAPSNSGMGGETWYHPEFCVPATSMDTGLATVGLSGVALGLDHPVLGTNDMMTSINWLDIDPASSYFDTQLPPQMPAGPMQPLPIHQLDVGVSGSPFNPIGNTSNGIPGRQASHDHSVPRSSESIAGTTVSVDSGASGAYYVDGDGGRDPTGSKRRKLVRDSENQVRSEMSILSGADPLSGFPDWVTRDYPSVQTPLTGEIRADVYEDIRFAFNQLCLGSPSLFEPFQSAAFPSLSTLNGFVKLYFKYFHPVYPFLHLPTWAVRSSPWLLTLAIATIGSRYSTIQNVESSILALHEFLRRAVNNQVEKNYSELSPVSLLQAALLNCIGLFYTGNRFFSMHAAIAKNVLVELFSQFQILNPTPASDEAELEKYTSIDTKWAAWAQRECSRRTGYYVWLLDTMLQYQFDLQVQTLPDNCQSSLPCHEDLWDAQSANEWYQTFNSKIANPPLPLAIQQLYIGKKVKQDVGELSRVLLIHAIYHETWNVCRYFKRPLFNWVPAASQTKDVPSLPISKTWLPAIPLYCKWRNSACDSLDILHWAANATTAAASGVEHPAVGHLHLARIVLLTPFNHFRHLAYAITERKIHLNSEEIAFDREQILRWVTDDQHKARLSLIHAGVTLWHTRRFSVDSFHEPVAVFLATLTLWAYGFFHRPSYPQPGDNEDEEMSSSSPNHSTSSNPNQPSEIPNPKFVSLDRPCDDELVQLFVRQGDSMRGCITGVWDICSEAGPESVLREGLKIIGDLEAWGIRREYMEVLDGMISLRLRRGRV